MAGGRHDKPWRARPQNQGSEQGFSVALALLVVVGALGTALAITGRTLSNRQARQQVDAGLTARDAAEIGMTRIIAELNRPVNRRLLVNAPQLGAAGRTLTGEAGINGAPNLRNVCDSSSSATAPDLTTNGAFNSSGTVLNNERSVPDSGDRLRYSLVAVSNGPNSNEQDAGGNTNPAFAVTVGEPGTPGKPGVSGTITLDVRGRVVEGGQEKSRYNLRKTFAVVPRCCGAGFGGFTGSGNTASLWGNDSTACRASDGYGLILGARRDLTSDATRGSFTSWFAIFREIAVGGTTTEASRIYCTVNSANPLPADCPQNTTFSRSQLVRRNITLPSLPFPINSSSNPYGYTSNISALTGSLNPSTIFTPNNSEHFSNPSNVAGYARLRVCDYGIYGLGSNATAWPRAGDRAVSVATLSTLAPRIGCNITVNQSETLETRNFDDWDSGSLGNTLKWHLGRLCQRITWPRTGTGSQTTIYCNLSSLTIANNATITFDTAGSTANSSIPIILSFPNGNNSLIKIASVSRTNNVVRLNFNSSHSFTSGDQVAVRDLSTDLGGGSGSGGSSSGDNGSSSGCLSGSNASTINSSNNSATPNRIFTITSSSNTSSARWIQFTANGSNFASTSSPCPLTNGYGTVVNVNPTIDDIQPILRSNATIGSLRQTNSRRTTPRITDLSVYGCGIGQSASCRFQTTEAFLAAFNMRDLFVYAPYASMRVAGALVNFRGAYWGNKLDLAFSGSRFEIPNGSADQLITAYPNFNTNLDRNEEFLARSVISVSTFSD